MSKFHVGHLQSSLVLLAFFTACVPGRDLDATASGRAGAPSSGGSSTSGALGTTQGGTDVTGTINTLLAAGGSTGGAAISTSAAMVTGGVSANSDGGAPAGGTGATSTRMQLGGTTSVSTSSTLPVTSGGVAGAGGSVSVSGGGAATATGGASNGGATLVSSGGDAVTGGTTATGGVNGTGGVKPTGGTRSTSTAGIAPELGDLINPPVQGYITYSSTASWEISGVQKEAFRIETPTATYFVVKSIAAIASLMDANGQPWVVSTNGYRTHRGVPNLGGCCQPYPPSPQPAMTTVLDASSVSSTHLRLVSKPIDGDYYWLVWDFYVTHVTVTVNRSREAFGFTYDGVPGNTLDANDQLVLSNGEAHSSKSTYIGDLSGPVEWVYITNGEAKPGSIFLIQHGDDDVEETYTVPDGDGSRFAFGSGGLRATPIRFSLGLIDSIDHATVSARVAYVIQNTPQ